MLLLSNHRTQELPTLIVQLHQMRQRFHHDLHLLLQHFCLLSGQFFTLLRCALQSLKFLSNTFDLLHLLMFHSAHLSQKVCFVHFSDVPLQEQNVLRVLLEKLWLFLVKIENCTLYYDIFTALSLSFFMNASENNLVLSHRLNVWRTLCDSTVNSLISLHQDRYTVSIFWQKLRFWSRNGVDTFSLS